MRHAQRISKTSVDAYYAMVNGPELERQERAIVTFLAHNCARDWTRNEIAEATGIRLSSVCGRINRLVELQIVIEADRRPDRITGVGAHPVSLAPIQAELI